MTFAETAEDIFAFLSACQQADQGCALGVVTGVTGVSARSVGALVAIRADGAMAGYVSHGCVDGDLRLQAVDATKAQQPRQLVYGTGSPFVDLRLPCGGTVEVLVIPDPSPAVVAQVVSALDARKPLCLRMSAADGQITVTGDLCNTGWQDAGVFCVSVRPRLQVFVAGTGPAFDAMATLAAAMEIPLHLASPDPEDKGLANRVSARSFQHLMSPTAAPSVTLDDQTAVLTLFHDHAWEPEILKQALASEAFYVGALGSPKTQTRRLETLRALGVPQHQLDRLIGPIGVIGSARDAKTLALSALTQIVDAARRGSLHKTEFATNLQDEKARPVEDRA